MTPRCAVEPHQASVEHHTRCPICDHLVDELDLEAVLAHLEPEHSAPVGNKPASSIGILVAVRPERLPQIERRVMNRVQKTAETMAHRIVRDLCEFAGGRMRWAPLHTITRRLVLTDDKLIAAALGLCVSTAVGSKWTTTTASA